MFNSAKTMTVAALIVLVLGGTSHGGYVVNVTQSGGDVVAAGSGTIDPTDLTPPGLGNAGALFNGILDVALFGPSSPVAATYYDGINDPNAFGTVDYNFGADSGNGDLVGVQGSRLWLPQDYVSGSLLNSTDTFSGQTFASLGLTPGTYTWTWGSGADADFFTMNIGGSSVPEPSSLLLASSGLGLLALAARARRRVASSV
jgi:PEP-CTERM motif